MSTFNSCSFVTARHFRWQNLYFSSGGKGVHSLIQSHIVLLENVSHFISTKRHPKSMASSKGSDGWQTVKRSGHNKRTSSKKSRRKRAKHGQPPMIPVIHCVSESNISLKKLKRNTLCEIDKMAKSLFFERFIECLTSTMISKFASDHQKEAENERLKLKVKMMCLGLGSFSKSPSSMVQLALFCAVVRELERAGSSASVSMEIVKSELCDPVLSANEVEVLSDLGIIQCTDSVGRYPVDSAPNVITFCFMPHCPRMLYNNLLATNWPHRQSFDKLIIFGNSFAEYHDLSVGSDPSDPLHGQSQWIQKVNALGIVHEIDIAQWMEPKRASIASNAFAFQKLLHFTSTTTSSRKLKIRIILFLESDSEHIPTACSLRKSRRKCDRYRHPISFKEHRYFLRESRIDVFDSERMGYWDSITFIPCTASTASTQRRSKLLRIDNAVIPVFVRMRSAESTSTADEQNGSIHDIDTVALHYAAQYVVEHRLRASGHPQIEQIIEGVVQCGIRWNVRSEMNTDSLTDDRRCPVHHKTMRKIFGNSIPQRMIGVIAEYLGFHRITTLTVDGEVTINGSNAPKLSEDEIEWTNIAELAHDSMAKIERINVEESSLEMDNGQKVKHYLNVGMCLDHRNVPCSLQRQSPFKSSFKSRRQRVQLGALSPMKDVFCRKAQKQSKSKPNF